MGGHRISKAEPYRWSDGVTGTFGPGTINAYDNFRPGEPNNRATLRGRSAYIAPGVPRSFADEHCIQMNHAIDGFVGQWNDAICAKRRGWICELCFPSDSPRLCP